MKYLRRLFRRPKRVIPLAFKMRWSPLARKVIAMHLIDAEHRSAL